MIEPGFTVSTHLPFRCQDGAPSPSAERGSLLLLRVVNLLDAGESEPDRTQERIEARLDLILYWLGQQLFGSEATPAASPLRLEANRIAWQAEAPPATAEVTLTLYVHPALAAPLRLAGRVVDHTGGYAVAELVFQDEELSDAWTQWLFRRHRRAVHEARQRAG